MSDMSDPFFFGYGSLVNRATHDYGRAVRARLGGWRRAWRHSAQRRVPFLTAVPCPDSTIEGLLAQVPGGDWQALDLRETGYARLGTGPDLAPEADGMIAGAGAAQIYAVPSADWARPEGLPPVQLSYVDVVLQGYLREFGPDGVRRFLATTDGWDIPIQDDRSAPLYPRHQLVDPADRAWFDSLLAGLGVTILRL